MAAGPIRAGKTTQFLTLPGRKFAFIFDPNAADTLRQFSDQEDFDVELFLPDNLNFNMQGLDPSKRDRDLPTGEPTAYKNFAAFFHSFINNPDFEFHHSNYDTILFDGLTAFQEITMDRALFINGKTGKWPEIPDWTTFANAGRKILRELTGLQDKIIYAPAHMELKDTKLLGITQVLRLQADLKGTIPPMFTDIWYYSTDLDDNGKPIYRIQTHSDQEKRTLGCSMSELAVFEDVTLDLNRPLLGQGVGGLLARAGVL